MKIRYVIIALLLFLFVTPEANAYMCSKSDMLRVKGDANNVKITYEHVKIEETGNITTLFNVYIKGITEDISLINEKTGVAYGYNSSVDGVIKLANVDTNEFVFKLYYRRCNNELMRTIKFTLPKYNIYSQHDFCKNVDKEEVYICDEWYQGELTPEIFDAKMKEYQDSLEEQKKQENKVNTIFKQIINFLVNYYLYIIATIVLIVIVTILIVVRRKRSILE